jgi:RNA polymerase sigma-70 factor (ECF subfamily)
MMLPIRLPKAVRAARHEGVSMRSEAEFAALYQARFADLASQLYAYLGDSAEAQDVVQEAFVRAWQRWTKISDYDDPVAWVRRVAWNLATSRHRRVVVARRFISGSRPPEHQPGATPDRVALVAALRRLPEQQRRAVVLHYLADLSVADIARDTGAPEGTVKSWLHRGRAALAKHLSDRGMTDRSGRRPVSATCDGDHGPRSRHSDDTAPVADPVSLADPVPPTTDATTFHGPGDGAGPHPTDTTVASHPTDDAARASPRRGTRGGDEDE